MYRQHVRVWFIFVGILLLSGSVYGEETPVTLTDLNSTVKVYSQSDAGIASWVVDGVEQLKREWFWFRVDPAGAGNPEQSIDTLSRIVNNALDLNDNAGLDVLYQKFSSAGQFTVALTYALTGGESGTRNSDLALSIKITNTGTEPLDFHFFQLKDLDIAGTAAWDRLRLVNNSLVEQSQNSRRVTTIFSPLPSVVNLNYSSILYDILVDNKGDDFWSQRSPVGPGDVQFLLQWDVTLPPGGNLLISEDQQQVPEPATMAMLALGTVAMFRRKRAA